MQKRSLYRRGTAAVVLAIALSAGTTSAVLADAKGGPTVVVQRSQQGSVVGLVGGAVIRTTTAAVSRERLVAIPGSAAVAVTWTETDATGRMEDWYAFAADGRTFHVVTPTTYLVRLAYASFDPLQGEPPIDPSLRAGAGNELHLVQFVIPPVDEFRAAVREAGGTVERFLTDHTHVVRMDAAAAARVAALPFVRWVGAYHPAYRLERSVLRDLTVGGTDQEMLRYSIEVMRHGMGQQQAIADLVTAMGGVIDVVTPDGRRMEATMSRAALLAVAAQNEVNYIDPWPGPGGHDMDIVRQIGGAVPTLSGLGFLGQGVRGEVFDTEVISNHQQWNGQTPLLHGINGNSGLHGSSCYGINFATGTGNAQATGLLPQREQGIFYWYEQASQFGGPQSRLQANMEATDPNGPYRSCYQTSSVGNAQVTAYTTLSAETDDYLFQVDYLSFQSQSNTGNQNSRPQAWAKNIVSVGGIDHQNTLTRNDDVGGVASHGPAADGRVKPDLAHFYDSIFTTDGSGSAAYTQFGGTSGATPITAGHGGLLMQMWHEGVWSGFGGGSSVFADRPRSTTAKAMLINTAYRYFWAPPAPAGEPIRPSVTRMQQGWGMANLATAYNRRERTFIVNETDVLLNGQVQTYHVNVIPGEPTLNVTMIYSDPPGTPAAAQARINDLSLRVTSPGGAVYWGNNGLNSSNWSSPGGTANTIDTVENVFIQDPEPGPWTIEVIATSIVQDARLETPGVTDADFALVATGVTLGPPPPLVITFPSGAPALIAPGATTNLDFMVFPGTQGVQPGSPALLYRMNGSSSFVSVPATSLGGDAYRAVLPAPQCGDTPQFYFQAAGDQGATATLPVTAPAGFFTSEVGTLQTTTILTQDFGATLPAGWAATGLWHASSACAPSGTPCAGPEWMYYGQDSTCNFDTGGTNSGSLTSPPIDLTGVPAGTPVTLTFCSALQTEADPNYDRALIMVNGSEVVAIEDSAGWETRTVDLTAFAGQMITLEFRFDTVDNINNNFRGWQVDNVKIEAQTTVCNAVCYPNCDQSTIPPVLNVNDFICFQAAFAAGASYANCDNSTTPPVLNVNDFICFQSQFAAGCP